MSDRNLAELMRKELPEEAVSVLADIGRLADERATGAYVVGGLVRDVLLGTPSLDLDIVVEERAEDFAAAAAVEFGGTVKAHTRFGTAILTVPPGLKIDVATARSEVYERPGALPVVRPGTIREDLRRRDFTMNALAIRLNDRRFGELLDYYSGERDLESGVIRVLHDGSFSDDPTRILRGVRFSARLGFSFDDDTERLALRTLSEKGLSTVSGERIANEIVLILKESDPWPPVARLAEWGVLRAVDAEWTIPEDTGETFAEIDSLLASGEVVDGDEVSRWKTLFAVLLRTVGADVREAVLDRLNAGRHMRMIARELAAFQAGTLRTLTRPGEMSRSEIFESLSGYSVELLTLACCGWTGESVAERARLYLSDLRHVECALGGSDLVAMGVPEGETIGSVLSAVLRARLDGGVTTESEERELAAKLVGALDEINNS